MKLTKEGQNLYMKTIPLSPGVQGSWSQSHCTAYLGGSPHILAPQCWPQTPFLRNFLWEFTKHYPAFPEVPTSPPLHSRRAWNQLQGFEWYAGGGTVASLFLLLPSVKGLHHLTKETFSLKIKCEEASLKARVCNSHSNCGDKNKSFQFWFG